MTCDDFTAWAARKGIALRFIEPGEPNQNAYIERFIQTLLREWAYAYRYPSSEHRADELQPWMHHYNFNQPHSATAHKPPASRLGFDGNNVLRNYS